MDVFKAIFLAVLQGLTEFLPVSSSAHLILPSNIWNWPDQGLAFDVAVHVGTLIAVCIYFRKDITQILAGWSVDVVKFKYTERSALGWQIILATIPAALAGLLIKDFIEAYRSLWIIAISTLVWGSALWFADVTAKQTKAFDKMSMKHALYIGLAQMLSLIPGTSRSGITMTAALALGYTRDSAARFSFLISIPIIFLAGSYLGVTLVFGDLEIDLNLMMVGIVTSFISAYGCIHFFLAIISRMGMLPFIIYRMILGFGLIIYLTQHG